MSIEKGVDAGEDGLIKGLVKGKRAKGKKERRGL